MRELFGSVLRGGGYEVLLARDGEEGVKLALSEKPDLVLMDLQMPVLRGVDAARRIKAEAPEVVVIAFTAHANDDDVQVGIRAGCDGVILKPSDPNALVEQVRLCLEDSC
jgi:two-component system cell cycle response regulator DivK